MITLQPLENIWWKVTRRSRRGLFFCSPFFSFPASKKCLPGCQKLSAHHLQETALPGLCAAPWHPNVVCEEEQIQASTTALAPFVGLLKVLMKTKFFLSSACSTESLQSEELTTRTRNPTTLCVWWESHLASSPAWP